MLKKNLPYLPYKEKKGAVYKCFVRYRTFVILNFLPCYVKSKLIQFSVQIYKFSLKIALRDLLQVIIWSYFLYNTAGDRPYRLAA